MQAEWLTNTLSDIIIKREFIVNYITVSSYSEIEDIFSEKTELYNYMISALWYEAIVYPSFVLILNKQV